MLQIQANVKVLTAERDKLNIMYEEVSVLEMYFLVILKKIRFYNNFYLPKGWIILKKDLVVKKHFFSILLKV